MAPKLSNKTVVEEWPAETEEPADDCRVDGGEIDVAEIFLLFPISGERRPFAVRNSTISGERVTRLVIIVLHFVRLLVTKNSAGRIVELGSLRIVKKMSYARIMNGDKFK